MKKLFLTLITLSVLGIGCRGKQGSSGPQGTPGLNPNQEVVLSGQITSDVMTISDPRIQIGGDFTAFISSGAMTTTLPSFLSAYGVNAYIQVQPTTQRIILLNAQKSGAMYYEIIFNI